MMKTLIQSLEKTDFVIANYKTKIEFLKLRNTKPWLNTKFLTPNEVIDLFLGRATDRTLSYIIEKNNLPFFHAKVINDNIIFPNMSHLTPKTKELSLIREQLVNEGYFDEIRLAKATFFQKRVLLSPELSANELLVNLLESTGCEITYIPQLTTNTHTVIHYENGIIEIYALLNKIAKLIDEGINPDSITIITNNSNYQFLIRAFAPSFNLKIESEKVALSSFAEVKEVLNALKENPDNFHEIMNELDPGVNEALVALKSLYLNLDSAIFSKVDPLLFFTEKVKTTKVSKDEGECISFSKELPLFSANDEYYFIPNFAEGNFSSSSSSLYLNNLEKIALGLNSAAANGAETELMLTHSLQNLKNVYLSFSPLLENDDFTIFGLSKKLGFATTFFDKDHTYYSQAYLNYVTGNDLDTRLLFNKINKNLSYYAYFNRDLTSFNSFKHEFKGISYRPENVYLSYSRINMYQRNPFDYFAQYLLGLTDDFNNPKVNFGNFVHKILEHSRDEATFKFNFYRLLDDETLSAKERFYIVNRQDYIFKVFQNYLSYIDYSKPTKIITEEVIKVKISEDCTLEGRIDNLFVYEVNGINNLLVVDYKTGTINKNENLYNIGLNLQLPLYGLLLNLSPKFSDAQISGLVYSSLKLPAYTLADEQILSDVAWKNGRFTGTIIEGDALNVIDPKLGDESDYFMGIKRSKGTIVGTISKERLIEHISIAESKVFETYRGIKASEFRSNVKIINRTIVSDYGNFRNISYLPLHDLGEEESGGEDDE